MVDKMYSKDYNCFCKIWLTKKEAKILKNNIKALRAEMNMSQSQLAGKARISRPYLSYIENGHAPSLSIAKQISSALGETVDFVFFTKMSYKVDNAPEEVS